MGKICAQPKVAYVEVQQAATRGVEINIQII